MRRIRSCTVCKVGVEDPVPSSLSATGRGSFDFSTLIKVGYPIDGEHWFAGFAHVLAFWNHPFGEASMA